MPRGLLASQRQPNVPNPPPPLYEDVILRIDREHWFANESPPAWAQYRDTLIKGTSWFDSIQGGVTLKKKKDIEKSTEKSTETSDEKRYVTGSFIGGFAPQSSYFDAEILIVSPSRQQSLDCSQDMLMTIHRQVYTEAGKVLYLTRPFEDEKLLSTRSKIVD